MRRAWVGATLVALVACGSSTNASTAPTSTAAAVAATAPPTTAGNTKAGYAQLLLGVRRSYMFHPGENYGKAAEALNQIVPPPGYELRHKQLVTEVLAVAGLSGGAPSAVGAAQGKAESDLLNLAHEADPSSTY